MTIQAATETTATLQQHVLRVLNAMQQYQQAQDACDAVVPEVRELKRNAVTKADHDRYIAAVMSHNHLQRTVYETRGTVEDAKAQLADAFIQHIAGWDWFMMRVSSQAISEDVMNLYTAVCEQIGLAFLSIRAQLENVDGIVFEFAPTKTDIGTDEQERVRKLTFTVSVTVDHFPQL